MNRYLSIFLLVLLFVDPARVDAIDGAFESLRQSGKAFASIAQRVSPSLVNIQIETGSARSDMASVPLPFRDKSPFTDEFLKRFFGERFRGIPREQIPQERQPSIGQGSGFVFAAKDGPLSDKTYILTNNHVVEGAQKIRVRMQPSILAIPADPSSTWTAR